MSKTVRAGQVFGLHGTRGAKSTLIGDSGQPGAPDGALIAVHGVADNQGLIDLLGGPGYHGLASATGAVLRVTGVLTNGGTIDVAGGTDGVGSHGAVGGAAVEIAAGGSLVNSGRMVFDGAHFANYVDRRDGDTSGGLLRVNGVLTNTGTLLIEGSTIPGKESSATAVVAGVLTNAGRMEVGAGADGGPEKGYGSRGSVMRVLQAGTLVNNGYFGVGLGNYGKYIVRATGAATLQIAGLLTNNGTLNISQGSARYSQGSRAVINDTGTLVNHGVLKVSGGGGYAGYIGSDGSTVATLSNHGVLTNLGMIDVINGSVLDDDGVLTNGGTMDLAGSFHNYDSYNRASTLAIGGTLDNTGNIVMSGGNDSEYENDRAPGALLENAGSIDNTGTIKLLAGNDGDRLGGATLSDAGVLTNAGLIEISGGSTDDYRYNNAAMLEISGSLVNLGTLMSLGRVLGYGLISIESGGVLADPGTIVNTGVLINAGTISSGAAGVTTGVIDTPVENKGLIAVAQGGALDIGSYIFGTGQISIEGAGVLTLDTIVRSGQAIDLAGAQSVLALGDAAACYATIEGLGVLTAIDFLGMDAISASATGTVVNVGLLSGVHFDLSLAAPLANYATLTLVGDLHGGTELTVTGSDAARAPVIGAETHDDTVRQMLSVPFHVQIR